MSQPQLVAIPLELLTEMIGKLEEMPHREVKTLLALVERNVRPVQEQPKLEKPADVLPTGKPSVDTDFMTYKK